MSRLTLPCLVAASLLLAVEAAECAWPKPRRLDKSRLRAAGLRLIESDHATLVTDLARSELIDDLPALIDLGLPQWGDRFGVRSRRLSDWRLRIYLIEDEAKFRSLGLWPDQSTDFPHALSLGHEVWIRRQKTDYYQRHLLLHEATHSFMSTVLGSCGPGWYMEGMAELCGTHDWDGESLRLAVMPPAREAVPDWGRIRLIREAIADGKLLSIDAVRKIDNRTILPAESYAWVWALCHFLDNHPAYRDRFGKASGWVTSDQFDRRFKRMFSKERRRLDQEWRLFVSTLVYGHAIDREAIDFAPAAATPISRSRSIQVQAERGWQSSGIEVEAGRAYRISAKGRFVIGREPDGTPWPCEAGGITLAYHAGRPIGRLLATIDAGPGAFVEADSIGARGVYRPAASGTLFLRVNDSPSRLAENSGELAVTVAVD